MRRFVSRRKLMTLAAFTTGTCWIGGLDCIQAVLASIGATFF